MSEKDFASSPEQAEQLSGKVVCDDFSEPHEMGAGAGGKPCVNPRPAQPQAPALSLDALGDLSDEEIERWDRFWLVVGGVPAPETRRLIAEVKRRRAAPSAPSDALRKVLDRALKTLAKWKAAWSERDRHTAIRMRVEANDETLELLALDLAALAASPSVTHDAINDAWIKGCLAGREEAARLAAANERHATAEKIRNLPAPTAPKEPQR